MRVRSVRRNSTGKVHDSETTGKIPKHAFGMQDLASQIPKERLGFLHFHGKENI
jgi:hypothetical protein